MEPLSIAQIAARFESLCSAVLKERGYSDDTETENWRNPDRADFVGTNPLTKQKVVAEFKLTLSSHVRPTYINQAISALSGKKAWFKDAQLLLIISTSLPEVWMNTAKAAGIDVVWDLAKLLSEASQTKVFPEMRSFLTDVGVADLGTLGEAPNAMAQTSVLIPPPPSKKGAQLCTEIQNVPDGRSGWRGFEDVCVNALKHLFGDQFGSWQEQSQSDEGFHRRDFLVRLRPQHDFWISLAHDFRSRYVVFEFKNYADPIGQNEIYSTEKYLFTTALRAVCFIIARKGASNEAYRAASGALREAGKLILIISVNDLCEMLQGSDRGEEPEILLYSLLDQVLTKMLR